MCLPTSASNSSTENGFASIPSIRPDARSSVVGTGNPVVMITGMFEVAAHARNARSARIPFPHGIITSMMIKSGRSLKAIAGTPAPPDEYNTSPYPPARNPAPINSRTARSSSTTRILPRPRPVIWDISGGTTGF